VTESTRCFGSTSRAQRTHRLAYLNYIHTTGSRQSGTHTCAEVGAKAETWWRANRTAMLEALSPNNRRTWSRDRASTPFIYAQQTHAYKRVQARTYVQRPAFYIITTSYVWLSRGNDCKATRGLQPAGHLGVLKFQHWLPTPTAVAGVKFFTAVCLFVCTISQKTTQLTKRYTEMFHGNQFISVKKVKVTSHKKLPAWVFALLWVLTSSSFFGFYSIASSAQRTVFAQFCSDCPGNFR